PSQIKIIDGMPYHFDAHPLDKPKASGGSRIQPGLERYPVSQELSKEEQQKYQTPYYQDDFAFPKPVEVMKQIIFANFNPDSLVVDFFAGSGTTGQAVLELNREDGGKRQFIL
ncbi:hypothetical protein DICVIV_13697, partial [Dictyocaulus viviparus]